MKLHLLAKNWLGYKFGDSEKGVGLDRLNSEEGYTPENVVPCCTACNKIKGDILSATELQIAIEAILCLRNLSQ